MGLDHVMLKVKNWHKAKEYYTAALQPLGYEPIADWGTGGGFSVPGERTGSIFIVQGSLQLLCHVVDLLRLAAEPSMGPDDVPGIICCAANEPTRIHVALAAQTEQALRDYYSTAIKHGGKDNGAPGPREHISNGLACFVIDVDNNNIECDYRA